ncbi:hypothetical protein NQ318_017133 [Aromia moschata]|uniref:Centrosomal protein of 290 kDa n=1 Tax=Aromia moschata TaxID=1265417 RepID=A0AAV8X6M0_9CUCU|nr:hypothetical protein NQ318_017133 [Aromia moschata]
MDWKYILALVPEDLREDEKDELFDAVAWFESDKEEIDLEKCRALFRVSQGDSEVQEGAGRAKREARRLESDTDARSSRSRVSSSIEFENLEQKYAELKAKYKKVTRNCENYKAELDKANSRTKKLEQENRRLQDEIESRPLGASSESEASETMRDQHRELVETIRNKNKQISDLLRDIEEVEKENFIMRDKLSNVRDELASATKEITTMTEILRERDAILEDKEASYKEVYAQYEMLKREFEELQQEKSKLRQEMEEFAAEIDAKVDEWKKILDQREAEIQELKSRVHQTSVNSSLSSLPKDDGDASHVNALQKILSEREEKLLEVQAQLQLATREMIESTEVLRRLKKERDEDAKKIKELNDNLDESRRQLKAVHGRCRALQEEVSFAEKTASTKDKELKEILNQMKENGQVELAVQIKELQELKADNRVKERHIANLVKACNKLQDGCDVLERENSVLRDKLGVPEDEQLTTGSYTTKQKKQRREFEALKKQFGKTEEEKLDLKSELHRLNGIISSLTNQILDLGHKPQYDQMRTENATDWDLRKENKALVDENEALRKGMHEILNSVNVKKATSLNEIKSDTLEKLLRALDVKHISGWYHPAMRLQAELHNIEGINIELREQLREARIELQRYKSEEKSEVDGRTSETPREECKVLEAEPDGETNTVDQNTELEDVENSLLKTVNVKELTEEELMRFLESALSEIQNVSKMDKKDVFKYLEARYGIVRQQILMLFTGLLKEQAAKDETLKSLEDKYAVCEIKLKILESNETDEEKLKKLDELAASNVSIARKVTYLEREAQKLSAKSENLVKESAEAQKNHARIMEELSRSNKRLETDLKIMRNLNEMSVDFEVHKQVKNDLDNVTVKYRELIETVKQESEAKFIEIKMLQEAQGNIERDKAELKTKLIEVLSKLNLQSVTAVSDKLEKLAKQLAECEVNQMTEKQRANHTNNLYELVKEQLNKSEERFREYSKYNEDLLKRNLVLQEQLKQAEDKLCDYVDRELYKQLQTANNELEKHNELLKTDKTRLEEELRRANESFQDDSQSRSWTSCKQQELLHLKHQIVDLIAVSDEKMIIAQLNSDLFHCRQSENLYRTRLDETVEELRKAEGKLRDSNSRYEQDKLEEVEKQSQLKKKLVLQNLLSKQKQQYLGCVPLHCEEMYLENLRIANKEKHEIFLTLHKIKTLENDAEILKEQLELELQNVAKQLKIIVEGDKEEFKNVINWMQEKKALQINELRYKRQAEFKETQLQHFKDRVRIQDEQIAKLDEELLLCHRNFDTNAPCTEILVQKLPEPSKSSTITFQTAETQTDEVARTETQQENRDQQENDVQKENRHLKSQVASLQETLGEREQGLTQLKGKFSELEVAVGVFRKQLGDKQSQIVFYERHIMELQSKKQEVHPAEGAGGDNINVGAEVAKSNEEVLALKINALPQASVKTLQETLKVKEEEIVKYQTLLKADRDNHSLAAARLQEELQNLQKALSEEKQKCLNLEETFAKARPSRAAIEQYMTQVHALEKHTAELHTNITSLEAQLQSSRQEAVRWRSLANDRLAAMEELRNSLEEQHKNELSIYKTDSEKLKELGNDEVNRLKQLIARHKSECTGHLDIDIERLVKEKEEKIHELTVRLRQVKNEARKVQLTESSDSPKADDLEASKELLLKEHELLKKRYEQLLNKERGAREEIRDLKAQLLKKPSAARSDRTDKSIKDQLQRKVTSLENEVADLRQSLAEQVSINDTHRVQATEDFEKWKRTKHWQQTAEKLRGKLRERDGDLEKLQQTCSGYRLLIERLEREKHNLENRIKTLKGNAGFAASSKEIELLRIENMRLLADVEALTSRLEMQQHHSGGLGAAMMQEKLESQERKIAVLELTAKVLYEV